jgi:hypothetical protein
MKAFNLSLLALAAAGFAIQGMAADDAKSTVSLGYSGYIDTNYNEDINAKNGGFSINQFGININAADSATGIKGELSVVNDSTSYDIYTRIDQAFVDKTFFGSLDAKLGRFYTFVGFEGVPTVGNFNESYSLLFDREPTTHDGLELNYAVNGFNVLGMVAQNSYDSGLKDYGFQFGYTADKFSLDANYLLHPVIAEAMIQQLGAPVSGLTTENQHTFNVVASASILDSLKLAAEYFYITELASDKQWTDGPFGEYPLSINTQNNDGFPFAPKSPKMQGYSLYGNYTLNDFSLSPRFTALYMPDGTNLMNSNQFLGTGQPDTQFQYTLTAKYKFGALTTYLEGNWVADCNASKVYGNDDIQGNVLAGASYQF